MTSSSSSTSVSPGLAPAKRKVVFDLSQMQPWREFAVILCDDDTHSQDEVVAQLVKALGCSPMRAHELMRKVENAGRASVAIAGRERAMRIAAVLRQIELRVLLRQIN